MSNIYLIAELREVDERGDTEPVIDFEDYPHGFFVSREDAEAYLADLNREPQERYGRQMVEYHRKVEEHRRKDAEAKALGFEYSPHQYPRHPTVPLLHMVVEVEPGFVPVKQG